MPHFDHLIPNGCYILKDSIFKLIKECGGKFDDEKTGIRPMYCCIKDIHYDFIYWVIPTSSIKNRDPAQLKRIKFYCDLPKHKIGNAYYHIGRTNIDAIYKVSGAFPITAEYVEREYIVNGQHLIIKNPELVAELERKLRIIIGFEHKNPNKLEQRITDIYDFLVNKRMDS